MFHYVEIFKWTNRFKYLKAFIENYGLISLLFMFKHLQASATDALGYVLHVQKTGV
jgi:hypothetical protein